jgi:TRAP-type C4-dicarboxylate transport system permease small subunit
MYLIGRFLSHLNTTLTTLGGLAIALMMLHVSLDVLLRYVFNAPLPGTITIVAYYYMIIAAFLPLAFAEQKNAHISVEVFTDLLPDRGQYHLAAWILPLSAAIFGGMAWRTWGEAVSKHNITASVVQGNTSIPVWPTYYVLPIGFGLLSLVLAYKFLVYLFQSSSGLDEVRARPEDLHTD